MKSTHQRLTATALGICLGLGAAGSAQAANWLMLQGTEKADNAPRAKVWGFIQPEYQQDFSDAHPTDTYIPPKLIGPGLDDQSAFNIRRARIGVRGTGFPLDGKVNYFLLAEFGNNAITNGGRYGDYTPALTDASVTLNYIPGARIRAGLFKTPGAEEALQGIIALPYINYTSVTNQLLLERFPDDGDSNIPPQTTPSADMNGFSQSAGAYRDTGIQIFDSFDTGKWEHSYAAMLGNGNGVQILDDDSNKDVYLYWSSAYLFDGKAGGPWRSTMKLFGWYQDGKRTNAYDKNQEQDRTRYGIGAFYLKRPFRVSAEYIKGEGMIFQGQHTPQAMFNDFKAEGGYVEGAYFVPNTPFELQLRYDTYNRNVDQPNKATFDTWTAGVQYHINKKTRATLNYAFRDFSSDAAGPNSHLEGVGDRVSVQLTAVF
ncbi:OprO/OprP family phosphate-selective porin [Guyparkeria hydrothermalis]|uniref:porin n=1 Tax=Guyparkeria TaxID=2035712 RepID=UPI0010ACAA4D|nr:MULTISPECIES: porin [Guyparkeria]MCL7751655.1 OprO/OprP family phosphate-selective porin [Guyparkeria hydrothermalis]TKA91751.1 porin [Guyparkeria sp. SB14A]